MSSPEIRTSNFWASNVGTQKMVLKSRSSGRRGLRTFSNSTLLVLAMYGLYMIVLYNLYNKNKHIDIIYFLVKLLTLLTIVIVVTLVTLFPVITYLTKSINQIKLFFNAFLYDLNINNVIHVSITTNN